MILVAFGDWATVHFRHWVFIPESEVFFVYSAIVFKAFQRGPTQYFLQKKTLFHVDLIKMLSMISFVSSIPVIFSSKLRIAQLERTIKMQEKYLDKRTTLERQFLVNTRYY